MYKCPITLDNCGAPKCTSYVEERRPQDFPKLCDVVAGMILAMVELMMCIEARHVELHAVRSYDAQDECLG